MPERIQIVSTDARDLACIDGTWHRQHHADYHAVVGPMPGRREAGHGVTRSWSDHPRCPMSVPE
jgi:hypothetical protein